MGLFNQPKRLIMIDGGAPSLGKDVMADKIKSRKEIEKEVLATFPNLPERAKVRTFRLAISDQGMEWLESLARAVEVERGVETNVAHIIAEAAEAAAAGWRRPGSWERQFVQSQFGVAESPEED